jgi:hypothetical protein
VYVCGVFGFPYRLQQTVSEYSSDAPALHKVHKGFGFFLEASSFGCNHHLAEFQLHFGSCRLSTCLPAKEPENASDGNRDYLYERTGPLHTNYPCPEQPHFLVLLLVSKYSVRQNYCRSMGRVLLAESAT